MKAVVHETYGPPSLLRIADVPRPSIAKGEVLVRVHATAVNAYDWHFVRGDPFPVRFVAGLLRPRRTYLGVDIAGIVESVGREAGRWKPGDAVVADISMPGGRGGGFAEFVAAPSRLLASKPAHLTFEEAAAVPMAGVTALQALRDVARLEAGQRVLVHGASGGVGTFAVQIARAMGAHVTAACSTRKLRVAERLGAHELIDYSNEDPCDGRRTWDVILGVSGARSLAEYARALTASGTYVMVGGRTSQIREAVVSGWWRSRRGGRRFLAASAVPRAADLDAVNTMIGAGTVVPIIDRTYPLDEVADAIHYVEEGHAHGKVVIVCYPVPPTTTSIGTSVVAADGRAMRNR